MPYHINDDKSVDKDSVSNGEEDIESTVKQIDKMILDHNFLKNPQLSIRSDQIPKYRPWMLEELRRIYKQFGWDIEPTSLGASRLLFVETTADSLKRSEDAKGRDFSFKLNMAMTWLLIGLVLLVYFTFFNGK